MKKMMVGSIVSMSLGAGLMAMALTSNKTKNKANKVLNNAMDMINEKIDSMQ